MSSVEGKHAGGRPLKFESAEELQEKIDLYFKDCDPHIEDVEILKDILGSDGKPTGDVEGRITQRITKQKPYTITGLALALDTTRETLLDYEAKDEFSDTIKKAKQRCHNYAETMLFNSNPAGPIFNLKNNYGWRDKVEQENAGEQKIIVETRVRKSGDKD